MCFSNTVCFLAGAEETFPRGKERESERAREDIFCLHTYTNTHHFLQTEKPCLFLKCCTLSDRMGGRLASQGA